MHGRGRGRGRGRRTVTPAAPDRADLAALPPSLANLTEAQIEQYREAARLRLAVDTFSGFVRYMWSEIEPGRSLDWGWYMQLICDELEGLVKGVAPDGTPYPESGAELVINLPPGHAKSRLCSVFFPAWLWLHNEHLRLLTTANEGTLASRDSRLSREVITSDRYRLLQQLHDIDIGVAALDGRGIPRPLSTDSAGNATMIADGTWEPWGLSVDQKSKVNFDIARKGRTTGGGRVALGMMAKVLGKRGDGLIVDDPHDAKEVLLGDPSRVAERMREARIVYHGALLTRLNKGAWRLIVAQRLHVADLPGDLIDRGARVVCLPVHYDPDHPHAHPVDALNREPGELLAPAVHSEERDRELRKRLGPRHHDAQYEQRPAVEAGGSFSRAWFHQQYKSAPLELARRARFDEVAISLDCAFRDHNKADYVVATVWGHKRRRVKKIHGVITPTGLTRLNIDTNEGIQPGKYLLDLKRGRMGLFETCAMLRRLRARWPWVRLVLVEAKANGDAVIETMRREGHGGVVGYEPDRSKAARAEVSALAFESAEIWLPSEEHAPWLGDFVEEHVQFPAGAHDDQVDSVSQMIIRWALADIDDIAGELEWVNHL